MTTASEKFESQNRFSRMADFLVAYAPAIEKSLCEFQNDLETHAKETPSEAILTLIKTKDPHSLPGFRKAIHAVDDATLTMYGIQRSGGFIAYRRHDGKIEPLESHSYFSDKATGEFIIDPTPGVHAQQMGTTLDIWILKYPEFFVNRMFFCDKQTIARTLGVVYPSENRTFADQFHMDRSQLLQEDVPIIL
jgi:hypothetical protein